MNRVRVVRFGFAAKRDAESARQELERSLVRLHTDHFDLHQFHGITSMKDVEQITERGGAGEIFLKRAAVLDVAAAPAARCAGWVAAGRGGRVD
jgi:aryl-alcohol dehydrogenase-like predicted oxidoreductase